MPRSTNLTVRFDVMKQVNGDMWLWYLLGFSLSDILFHFAFDSEIGDDGPEYQMTLMQMTGQRTVPNVFVKGQHIGGNDDSQAAAKDGKLKEMLGLWVSN